MTIIQEQLDEKVLSIFNQDGVVVNKKLLTLSDRFHKLPRFVADYLISKLIDSENTHPGLAQIEKIMCENYVESDQRELIKSRIRENGVHSLLGQIRCRYDQSRDEYWADIGALGDQNIRIHPYIIAEYGDILLTTGAWGTIEISFDGSFALKAKKYPFIITRFIPFQITKIDLNSWINKRELFETDEWIDLLINTVGFNPRLLTRKEKFLYLIRLIPLVENNSNIVELGGVGTSKTFFYKNLSNYSFVISGSKTSVASLFYNKLRRQHGIITYKDCVAFDEIAHANWQGQDDLVSMLKDFMNSGSFGRDSLNFSSGASVVFIGNIDCDIKTKKPKNYYRHLLSPLPSLINNDRAFLDRIHGFIPGWQVPKVSESNFSDGIGFMSDYFAEILHKLRDRDYLDIVYDRVNFGRISYRDQTAVSKNLSGLLKLIFPHKIINDEELRELLDFSVKLRQRLIDQIKIICPGEFSDVFLNCELK